MLTLKWSIKALIDFDDAQHYIAHENAVAAQAIAERIRQATRLLQSNPAIGRPAHVPEARIWVVRRTPYLIAYRVRGETLEILRLWHGRRDWENVEK